MMEKYVLVVDTETANSIEYPLPYDFGWAVVDTETGEIMEEASFLCKEIFLNEEMMNSAYFAEKVPQYWEDVAKGTRKIRTLLTIRKKVRECMRKYNIHQVCAYNMGFDKRATINDTRFVTNNFIKWFFPVKTEFICIWHMACTSFLNTSEYINFAKTHGFVSKAGNIQTSAEAAYRYLKNDPNFEESHTGLEDVKIEVEIMMNCLKTGDENMKMNPYSVCWRIVQNTNKVMMTLEL